MHKTNWDDFRFVLAVARMGSVSAAARELGVNHATVLRRVAGIEDRLGVALFEKSVRGYDVAPEKLRLIEAAREVEIAVKAVERLAQAGDTPLAGVIRVMSSDTFCHAILPPVVAGMSLTSPGLSFELLCANAQTDASRLHADVIVRTAFKLPDDLYGEVAGQLACGVYAAEGVPEAHWLGMSGLLGRAHVAHKLNERLQKDGVVFRAAADSFMTLRALAEAGLGRTMLPCVIGDQSPVLQRVRAPIDIAPMPIYVASNAELADAPRLRQARARMTAALQADAERLLGLAPAAA